MRMLVLFDLPTGTKRERKNYSLFRKFLLNDGYTMEQYSIYSRLLFSRDAIETHLDRLKKHLPPAGQITVLTLTEKQYENRISLIDTRPPERILNDPGEQLTLTL